MSLTALVNGAVMTMDPERRVIESGTILIEDQHISAVGPTGTVELPEGARIIDAGGMVSLPGLINGHTHACQSLLRGLASNQDRRVWNWLINVVHPGLTAYRPEDITVAARLYCVEAIRSGMTCFVDNHDAWPDQTLMAGKRVMDVYAEAGVRAMFGRMMFDQMPDWLWKETEEAMATDTGVVHADLWHPTDALLNDLEKLIRAYNGSAGGRIQVWPAPTGVAAVSERLMRTSQSLARDNGTMWTIHLVQGPAAEHGATSIQWMAGKGLLDSRLLASHCVNVTRNDIALLKAADVRGCTQIASNSFLAMGMAPVPDLLQAGVTLGMGTDDVNCNGSVNLLSDMKTLALAHRILRDDPSALTPEKVLEMATIDGARMVGMEREIGSIEVGKRADVVLIDLRHPQMTPAAHLPSAIVFQAYGNEVDTVIIDGNVVMQNRQLTWLTPAEERGLYRDASERAQAIARRARIHTDRPWARTRTPTNG